MKRIYSVSILVITIVLLSSCRNYDKKIIRAWNINEIHYADNIVTFPNNEYCRFTVNINDDDNLYQMYNDANDCNVYEDLEGGWEWNVKGEKIRMVQFYFTFDEIYNVLKLEDEELVLENENDGTIYYLTEYN